MEIGLTEVTVWEHQSETKNSKSGIQMLNGNLAQ